VTVSVALAPGDAAAVSCGDGAICASDALGDASVELAADALLDALPDDVLPPPDVPHAASTNTSTLSNMNTRFICNSFVLFGRI
jgi:hypothetical protein